MSCGVSYRTVKPGNPPPTLDFNLIGTDFLSLAPQLNQTFLIGDGLTGSGSGETQRFIIPDGFVGIADLTTVLTNWNAGTPPTALSDNLSVPEPATLVLCLSICCLLPGHPAVSTC